MMYIKTRRLELKTISEACLSDLTELITDTQVTGTYMVPDFPSREAAEALARRLIAISEQELSFLAGIFRDDVFLGMINETGDIGGGMELGYAILPRYHNQGYCTEALQGAISWLFQEGIREVITGAFEDNKASIRVMEKAGMALLDRRDKVEYRGEVHSCVYYSAKNMD